MSVSRDRLNLAALSGLLGGKPPPREVAQPMQTAAQAAGGSGGARVFTGPIPGEWQGAPGGHPSTRSMRVTVGGGTWGIQVEIYSVDAGVETVHKVFDIAPMITKVCINDVLCYRCALMDPTTDAVA